MVIPTRDRLDRLEKCLRSLCNQTIGRDRFEVIVTVDGVDKGEGELCRALSSELCVRVMARESAGDGGSGTGGNGPAAARNRAISAAAGSLLLLLNDDVVCAADLVEKHVEAQREASSWSSSAARSSSSRFDGPVMVVGAAPWAVRAPDRRVDRLVRETSLVFFYDKMNSDDPQHDWGFRHAWTLNLSVATSAVREVGGFCEGLQRPVYEDVELAFRLRERFNCPVLYRPGAVVTHEHFYEPIALLEREAVLGHQSWRLAEVSPACALAIFGRDMRSDAAVRTSVQTVCDGVPGGLVGWFAEFSESVDDVGIVDDGKGVASSAAEDFERLLPIRRWCRALGHVSASRGESIDDALGGVRRAFLLENAESAAG